MYRQLPEKVSFQYTGPMLDQRLFGKHLEEDEHIVKVVHTHWIIGSKMLTLPFLSLVISLVLLLGALFRETSEVFVIAIFIWFAWSALWALRAFFDYYLDAWIITDKGIIDLEWHGWFHRESSRVLYSDIQGVSYEIKGISGTLMRYGAISVEKISTGSAISMADVDKPSDVQTVILKAMEVYLTSKNLKNTEHVQEILSGMVAQSVQLKDFGPKAPAKASAPTKKKGFQSRSL